MRITNSVPNLINFGSISLNEYEKEKSDKLISQLQSSENKHQIKSGLLDVFDKHIQNESAQKAKGIFFQEDMLQKMYLNFFEAIENMKDLTTEKLIDVLHSTKPDKNELNEQQGFGISSLDREITNVKNRTIKDLITEKDLPVYLSSASEEERKAYFEELRALEDKTNLTLKEKRALEEKSKGKTIKQIAKENDRSQTVARRLIINSIAKIQNDNGVLPEKFDHFTEKLIKRYDLDIEKDLIKNMLLNNTYLLSYPPEKLFQNLDKTAEGLELEPELFIQAAIKQPSIFYIKSETIAENIQILQYYKQIQNKDFDRVVISTCSNRYLYENILNYLVKQSDGLNAAINKNKFIKYLKESGKMYNFEIPANELADDFMEFARKFAEKNLGKQIFSFKVKI